MIKEKLIQAKNWIVDKAKRFWKWGVAIIVGTAILAAVIPPADVSFETIENVRKVGNKFEIMAQDNPKDRIKIDIGGDGADFKPEVKLTRWDEVSFKVGLPTDKKISPKQKNGKLKWEDDDIEIEFYEGEDSFKFVWYLNSKPASNIVEFEIESEGLDFFYQPELTQEEIDRGDIRPEDVVGSYAVYHKTKGGMNDINGMEYKTGKFGHIYRPRLIDSNGWETWGILHIENGIYSVEIPEDFYNNAVYPIRSNDDLGYTTLGGSENINTKLADYFSDTSFTVGAWANLSSAGTLDYIYVGTRATTNDTVDTAAVIYREDSAGANSHDKVVLIERSELSHTTTASFKSFTASSEELVVDDYILAAIGNGYDCVTGRVIYVRFDAGSGQRLYKESSTGSGGYSARKSEDPWGQTENASTVYLLSIYATYTPAAAGTNMKINIADTWKDVSEIKINIADVWKDVTNVYINVGDAWKTVF